MLSLVSHYAVIKWRLRHNDRAITS